MVDPWDYVLPPVSSDAGAAPVAEGASSATTETKVADTANTPAAAPTDLSSLSALVSSLQQGLITLRTEYTQGIDALTNESRAGLTALTSEYRTQQMMNITQANVRDAVSNIFNAFSGLMRSANGKWSIDGDGKIIAVDMELSGALKTVSFVKDTVSAVSGKLHIADSDTLAKDMNSQDAATLTITGATTYAANTILLMKDGIDTEYLRITDASNAPLYIVTRDLAGSYTANNNPMWDAGTAVVPIGTSDGVSTYAGGWLVADGTTPKYSVYKRTGIAHDAFTEYITIGNLNGRLAYSAEEYGIAIGTLASGYLSYDPTNGMRIKGTITAETINYSPNQIFALFQVGITELPSVGACLSMTRHGRYILVPYLSGATNQWAIWDAGAEYIYNYTRNPSITVTPLTILPRVSCVVLDGTTEYILGFAIGGTVCYRYADDGTGETLVTISGTGITTGAQRIGYDKERGYVYIMDGASEASTTIKRYTFAGSTLTYVDTITLSVAPAAGGPLNMWIGSTYLIMGDAYTNASRVDYQRYGRDSGVQASSKTWGHGTSGVNFVGHMIRMDDNALLFATENDTGAGTTSLIQKIFLE